MQLIGQYDSPYVRRVAITLRLYDLRFEHLPWSAFGDADKIAAVSPLRRVPALVFDDGVALTDSWAIIDTLDQIVGPARAMIASTGPDRREAMRLTALAAGAADKAVSLVYEGALRAEPLNIWVDRCHAQVGGALDAIEGARSERPTPWLFGDQMTHADVILATVGRFIREALPGAFDLAARPALSAHCARAEALAVFQEICQPFKLTPPGD